MNIKCILQNYAQRWATAALNFIPLRYHSSMMVRPFIHAISRNYWIKMVDDPACPNYYAEYYEDRDEEFRLLLDMIGKKMDKKPASFFEIGCNVGANLAAIAKICNFDKGISYFGCDLNRLSIENARRADYGGKADFCAADIEDIKFFDNFSAGSFDVIFSRNVFMHIEPGKLKGRIVKELMRISRGCLIFMEPWSGKDRAFYVNSHVNYYENMDKYLPRHRILIEDLKGLRTYIVYKKDAQG